MYIYKLDTYVKTYMHVVHICTGRYVHMCNSPMLAATEGLEQLQAILGPQNFEARVQLALIPFGDFHKFGAPQKAQNTMILTKGALEEGP